MQLEQRLSFAAQIVFQVPEPDIAPQQTKNVIFELFPVTWRQSWIRAGNSKALLFLLTMQMLIQIPAWIVAGLDLARGCLHIQMFVWVISDLSTSVWSFLQHQNDLWGFLVSLVLFWPLWVCFVIALTTASTWIFHLFALVSVGVLQVIHVSCQIVMIATNVGTLTLLKTHHSLMRSRLAHVPFLFSKSKRNSSQHQTSRQCQWNKQCK
jgi:hypothetical protein